MLRIITSDMLVVVRMKRTRNLVSVIARYLEGRYPLAKLTDIISVIGKIHVEAITPNETSLELRFSLY